ncbi:MAG: hypothetical protein QM655_02655, partial [Nocardioidaceae bacterium]
HGGGVSSTGAVSDMYKSMDDGSCSEVRDGPKVPWQTCEYELTSFSSDGQYVLGQPAYGDGQGMGYLAVLDAETGQVVRKFQTTHEGLIIDVRWDGEKDSLIALMYEGQSFQLVRLGVDGQLEKAGDPIETDDPYGDSTIHLTSQP